MLTLILVSFLVIVGLIHYAIHYSEKGKLFNKLPGPPILPFFGNALVFVCTPIELFHSGRFFSSQFKRFYRIWGVNKRIINIFHPDDIEIILSSPKYIKKSYLYDFLHPWLNTGLLTSTGQKWQDRRKILTPTFHFNILRQFCSVFEEQSNKLVEKLEKEIGNDATDILPYITELTLFAICETAMGTDLNKITKESRKYVDSLKNMSYYIVRRFQRMWLQPELLFAFSTVKKLQDKALKTLHDFTINVIRDRRSTINLNDVTSDNLNNYTMSTKKRLAMLDLLLYSEAKNDIDEKGIREEVDTFMFEGHDTTTMALVFCLMLLANHPDIQERIVQEIDEIFADSTDLTIEKLNKMQYLERCIKEALRLYPSVTMIGRYVTEDVQLKDYLVPAGTTYHIHIFDLHRREDIYPNPDKFDPERFTAENSSKRHPFAYIPFSAGPRNCIGQKYAILEEKAVIIKILKRFKLEGITKPDDIIFNADLVLKCRDPVKIKFLSR